MSSRFARPESADGAGWLVYDHLADEVAGDPAANGFLNAEQSGLVAFYDLRTQVNSDGFEGYFSYDYGDGALAALRMAARLGLPGWPELIAEAVALFGEPYPDDQDDRTERVDELSDAGVLDALDQRFYDLEGEHRLDALVDAYVWAHPGDFFAQAP